jgi:type IV pilus assembly protein PilB
MDTTRKTIIDVLLEKNRLTTSEAGRFDKLENNEQIEKKLRDDKMVSSEDIAKAYSVVYDLPFIRLENYDISAQAFGIIPRELIEKYKIIAFEKVGEKKIKVAIGSPGQLKNNPPAILAELKERKGLTIDLYITILEDIQKVLAKFANSPVAEVKTLEKTATLPTSHNLKTIDLESIKIPYDVISKFPIEISQKYYMVVFASPHANMIKVAVSDPTDPKVREILKFVREKNQIEIEEYVASPREINEAIKLFYHKPADESFQSESSAKVREPWMPAHKTDEADRQPEPKEVFKPILSSQSPNTNSVESVISDNAAQAPPASTNIRHKFIRRPIRYEVQSSDEQQPIDTEDTAVSTMVAPENDLDHFLGQPVKDLETFQNIVKTGNVPQILSGSIVLAVFMKASDIHIESDGTNLRFRFRIDGILKDILKAPLPLYSAIISRIKILSRLKIDETRIPQDGRFDVITQGHEIDLRISTLPTVRGEKAVMRILDKSQSIYTLADLGFTGRNLQLVEENITKPYGVILATGPTGSGKSTTLYSILKQISSPEVNVITLEDPVEYEMPGINQCQVKPKIGFSFAEGLRSVLRQDPNIIMVGEIRDAETAGLATQAALTGHLVLTTLHTNDASGALPRLTDMGIEPFLITSSINVVIGQRLVRKICPKCKHEVNLPPALLEEIEQEIGIFNFAKPYKFYEGAGCPECNNGYSGRMGIYEVLNMSEKIEALAISRRPTSEIKAQAISEGMTTMKQDGLIKALSGITSISEVLRVTLTD